MYNNYLIKEQSRNGLGVFSTVEIPAMTPIIEFRGDVFKRESIKHSDSQITQISHDLFRGPSGDIDDYINHSCSPNCVLYIIANRAIVYSLYVIPVKTELTIDYSIGSTDTLDKWKMNCNCGSANCRKIISGFQYLDESIKKRYEEWIPLFVKYNFLK